MAIVGLVGEIEGKRDGRGGGGIGRARESGRRIGRRLGNWGCKRGEEKKRGNKLRRKKIGSKF